MRGLIFLDSSLIVAYSNNDDTNHTKAQQIIEDIAGERYGTQVITDYVFDEVVTVMLARTRNLERTARFGQTLLDATQLVRIDDDLFNAAWKIFKQQRKPMFSFTDCTSIAVCKLNGISNIATFDSDFAKLDEFNVVGV